MSYVSARSMKGFLPHPSDMSQSTKWSWGTTDRLESDPGARRSESGRSLEGRIEMSPSSLTAALWSYNTGPPWVRCQLLQTNPKQHELLFEFWMDPLDFSPFTHDVLLSVFYPTPCSIRLHGGPFVSSPHPVWKGQTGTKERWGCISSVHHSVRMTLSLCS